MIDTQKIVLITGANKGIGFEIAMQLGQKDMTVLLGARNESRGLEAVKRLKEKKINAHFIKIDLNDITSIKMASKKIEDEFGRLDVLVNNAGIIDPQDGVPSKTDIDVVKRTFETNFYGTLAVTQAMLPLLRISSAGRIVNISSGLGSLAWNEDPAWEFADTKLIGYNASKAAVNMLTIQLAWELKDTVIKVNAANPNFTDTDLVPGAIGGRPVSEGARTAIELAQLNENGPTGKFFEDFFTGEKTPW